MSARVVRRAIGHLWLPLSMLVVGIPIAALAWPQSGIPDARAAGLLLGWVAGVPFGGLVLLMLLAPLALRLEAVRAAFPTAEVALVRTQHQDWLALRSSPSGPRHWFAPAAIVSFDDFGVTFWGSVRSPVPTCAIPWSAVTAIGPGTVEGDDGSFDEHALEVALADADDASSIRFAPAHTGRFRFGFRHGLPDAARALRARLELRWRTHEASTHSRWQRPETVWAGRSRDARGREHAEGRWNRAPILGTPWALAALLLGLMWALGPICVILVSDGAWRWVAAAAMLVVALWQGCLLALLLGTRWRVHEGELVVRHAGSWTRVPLSEIRAIEVASEHSLAAQLWLGIGSRVWFGLEARMRDGSVVALPELFGSAQRSIATADVIETRLLQGSRTLGA